MLDVMDCIVSRTDVKEVEAVRSVMREARRCVKVRAHMCFKRGNAA